MGKTEQGSKLFVYIIVIEITGSLFTSRVSSLQFNSQPQYVQFPENTSTSIGTVLFNLTATDSGAGSHMTIYAADELTKMYVNITGKQENNILLANISLNKLLDREEFVNGIELKFSLSDGKGNTVPKDVRLYILDTCDESPQFERTSYTLEIEENVKTGQRVSNLIHAIDRDNGLNAVIIYRMEPKTESEYWKSIYNETFAINPTTGELYVQQLLDYESNSFYQFTVYANDTCNVSLSATPADLTIRVKDIQDTPPFFRKLPYMKTITEGNYPNIAILHVEALDGDLGIPNKINYSLDNADSCSETQTGCAFCRSLFSINSTTGEITVSGNLDWEMTNVSDIYGTCTIEVKAIEIQLPNASQHGNTTSKTDVTVTILDTNNHAPRFDNESYHASIQENATQHTPILLEIGATGIKVSDKDQGSNSKINVSLQCQNNSDCDTFEVVPLHISGTGSLTITVRNNTLLDFEQRQSMTITVIATEESNASHNDTATVYIKIDSLNEFSPAFKNETYEATIKEDSQNLTSVINVTASDGDAKIDLYGMVTYSLSGGNNLFKVNNETGEVVTNCKPSQLDREQTNKIYLTIIATDGGGRINQAQIIVTLDDVNDNPPKFQQEMYTGFLEENSTKYNDTALVIVKATDADLIGTKNSKVSYNLGDGKWNSNFTINDTTGEIKLTSILDYEALEDDLDGVISFIVYAVDHGNERKTGNTTVNITVQDINDNGPVFSNQTYYGTIEENAKNGTYVAIVNATDRDKTDRNKKFSFAIEAGGFDKFRIDSTTGNVTIQVGADFDCDIVHLFNLTIIAIDQGTDAFTATTTLSVTINDVNNKPPKFNQGTYIIAMPENVSVGHSFNCCNAHDQDQNYSLNYSIVNTTGFDQDGKNVNQSAIKQYVQINKTNGTLYVNSKLDRETAETLEVIIFVTDDFAVEHKPQTATATVTINVIDSDDNPPKFTLKQDCRVGMRRNIASGTTILELKSYVTDKDQPENGANKWTFQNVSFEISPQELKNKLNGLRTGSFCNYPICVLGNGTIVNNMFYNEDMSGYFSAAIIVEDDAGNDTTNILIFLIADSQVLKMTIYGIRTNVATIKDDVLSDCSNVTGLLFVYDSIADHKTDDGKVDTSKTDLFFHIQDHNHNRVLSAEEAKRLLDEYAEKLYYARTKYSIASIDSSLKSGNPEDISSKTIYIMTAVIALLVLVIVIVGYMFFSSSNRYKRKLRAAMPPEKEINNKKKDEFITPGSNMYAYKENPLLYSSYEPPVYQEIDATSQNSLDTNEVDDAKLSTKGEVEEREVTLDIYGEDYYISEPTEDPLEAALRQHDNQKHASIAKLGDGNRENDDKKQTFTGFINKGFNDDLNLETSEI